MDLIAFTRMISNETGVSIVVSARLDSRPVSIEVREVEVGAVLALVARRLGVELTYSSGVYFIGELQAEDRGVYVRRVRRLDSAGLSAAIQVLLSTNGRVSTYNDGLVVVGDRVEVLQRVDDLLNQVESAGADSWVIQLHMVSTRRTDMSEFGLDITPALDVAANFASSSAVPSPGLTRSVAAGLNAILRTAKRKEDLAVLTEPMFILVDGGEANIADGDELRVPRFSITDEGTQSVTGFEIVQTGLVINVGIRDLGSSRAQLSLSTSISSVVGFVEGNLPTINRQSYRTNAVIRSGGVYLLGALTRTSSLQAVDGILSMVEENDESKQNVLVFARAYRISGGVLRQK